jgi:hypothetical protein
MATKFRPMKKEYRKPEQAPFVVRKLSKSESKRMAEVVKKLKGKQSDELAIQVEDD